MASLMEMVNGALLGYLVLWLTPSGYTQVVAAGMTGLLAIYLASEFLDMVQAWVEMADEVAVATTFEQIREASARFGGRIGPKTARLLVMAAMALLGSQGKLPPKLQQLPGFKAAAARLGLSPEVLAEAVAATRSAQVAEGRLTLVLPSGVLAMAAAKHGGLDREGAEPRASGGGAGAGASGEGLGSEGVDPEVLASKLADAEAASTGPRLQADLKVLEKFRPRLDRPPPGVEADDPRWREYVAYWEKRWEELTGRRPPERRRPDGTIPPPQTWETYKGMRGPLGRGLEYEAGRAAWYRAQGGLPVGQRAALRDFRNPLVVRNPGAIPLDLAAEESSLRYPDMAVLEQDVPPGQLPRLETWSFKSVDLAHMPNWRAEIEAHAHFAKKYYGGVLDLRRRVLRLRGKGLPVARVHVIFDARFKPRARNLEMILQDIVQATGVEIHFE